MNKHIRNHRYKKWKHKYLNYIALFSEIDICIEDRKYNAWKMIDYKNDRTFVYYPKSDKINFLEDKRWIDNGLKYIFELTNLERI